MNLEITNVCYVYFQTTEDKSQLVLHYLLRLEYTN